jgi:hypothetical protein
MTSVVDPEFTMLDYRRALEALRNGVPNRDAVRVLGCGQRKVEDAFGRQLEACRTLIERDEQAPGTLVAGGFGTGKSHLLEYLQHQALSANFVCSRIVISKETPLYDLAKVFLAAVESATVPGRRGQAVKEIAFKMKTSSRAYVDFYQWANEVDNRVSQLFPATLMLHEQLGNDPDLVEDVTNFWSGEPLSVARVRQGLKQCAGEAAYTVKAVPARQLATERFTFLARMILGAGYAGWVLLIDEVELIGRYSLIQRGRSYAELARWMGRIEGEGYPGLTAVAAITDDFDINVLQERGDSDDVGSKFRDKGTAEMDLLAARAETGMRIIERDALQLQPPTEETLARTYDLVHRVHANAHDWEPPDVKGAEFAMRRAMRSYVRRWINEWDLVRIYPGIDVQTEEEELKPSYGEDDDLQVAPEGWVPVEASE